LATATAAVTAFIDDPVTIVIQTISKIAVRTGTALSRRSTTLATLIGQSLICQTIAVVIDSITLFVLLCDLIHTAVALSIDAEPVANSTYPDSLCARATRVTRLGDRV
tara:strand:+ start:273 stop:596 length:324 start_codon:yes stop_codon:yes gene_type:complete